MQRVHFVFGQNGARDFIADLARGLVIKRSGVAIRYVIEDDNGRLFIHNAAQIGKQEGWMP